MGVNKGYQRFDNISLSPPPPSHRLCIRFLFCHSALTLPLARSTLRSQSAAACINRLCTYAHVCLPLLLQAKGVAFTPKGEAFDSVDLVVPSLENNAFFLTTQYITTVQNQSTCPDFDSPCSSDAACRPIRSDRGAGLAQLNGNCDLSVGRCTAVGWVSVCPFSSVPLCVLCFASHELRRALLSARSRTTALWRSLRSRV